MGFLCQKRTKRLTTYVLSQHTYVARVWVKKNYSIHLYNFEFWALINVKWRHLLKERLLLNVNHLEIVWLNKSIFFLNSDSEKTYIATDWPYVNWELLQSLPGIIRFFLAKVVKSRKRWKITKSLETWDDVCLFFVAFKKHFYLL